MYDTDEEIQKKRRTLFIIIGVIILLIIILIVFLLMRGSGKKKSSTDTAKEITCELEVKEGVKPDESGVYHQGFMVGFKSINAISKDYQITKQTIGTVDNSRNKNTFTVSKSGKYHLYGYVQDSAGHKGKCEISFEVSLQKPTCELDVAEGTLGDNNWYRSDVVVGFSTLTSNNPSIGIKQYYIEKITTDLDSSEVVKADPPTENIEKYTVKDNSVTTLMGHVIDNAGNEGTCKITISKDSTVPTCTLKVNSGNKDANGVYTDNPEIGFNTVNDDVSLIASKGIGISKNYTQTTYKVTEAGKTTVVGYVKDKAGNEGTCSIEITRPSGSSQGGGSQGGGSQGGGSQGGGSQGGSGGSTTPSSSPRCQIKLTHPEGENNGVYSKDITTSLIQIPNGAAIVDYGLGESATYNKKTTITITTNGPHKIYGIVKDAYGHTFTCETPSFYIEKGELLSAKVKVGDYVAYNPGNWNENRPSEQKQDGYYWGMKSGQSKSTGVKCDSNDVSTRNGWMVMNVYDGKVVLISAGTPECIYHDRVAAQNVVNVMYNEAKKYIDGKYAIGSTILSCNVRGFDCNANSYSNNPVFVTGTHYWVAQIGSNNMLNNISSSGAKQGQTLRSYGLRPIIELNPSTMTSGKNGNAWVLK